MERRPDDLREVGNYVVALEHGMARLKELPICVRLIKELHRGLMTGITAKGCVEKLGIAFTTAQRAIERLEGLNIVQQAGAAKRDRVYGAKALLDILEEPAQLMPSGN